MKDTLQRLFVVCAFSALLPATLVVAKYSFRNNAKAIAGTYQVISDEISMNSGTLDSLRFIIEAKRKDTEVVIYKISESTEIKILPRNEILSTQFKPLDEFVFVNRKVKHVDIQK
jgi:hypothetical protein